MNLVFLLLALSWLEAFAVRLCRGKGFCWLGACGSHPLECKLQEIRAFFVHHCIPDTQKSAWKVVKIQQVCAKYPLNEYSGPLKEFSHLVLGLYPGAIFAPTRGNLAASRDIWVIKTEEVATGV